MRQGAQGALPLLNGLPSTGTGTIGFLLCSLRRAF